jgi:hypothetical protein
LPLWKALQALSMLKEPLPLLLLLLLLLHPSCLWVMYLHRLLAPLLCQRQCQPL